MSDLYPLFFHPVYKDYIWGGERIIKHFHRKAPPGVYAESWEVSDREDGMSLVENGPLKGKSLHDLMQSHHQELLGKDAEFDRFPLLIKLIDAHDNLSVQVHPNDETAKLYGGEAKTEAWVVLETEVDAVLYAGFREHFPQEEIEKRLPTRDIITLMCTLPANRGDTVFIPGGRLHAIGSGCLLFEVQQNSNTTYRVYDWDRLGKDGKPRPLHLKEASQVILWDDVSHPIVEPTVTQENAECTTFTLVDSDFFHLQRLELRKPNGYKARRDQCEILFLLEGEAKIKHSKGEEKWEKGRSCLIPAACNDVELVFTKPLKILRVHA